MLKIVAAVMLGDPSEIGSWAGGGGEVSLLTRLVSLQSPVYQTSPMCSSGCWKHNPVPSGPQTTPLFSTLIQISCLLFFGVFGSLHPRRSWILCLQGLGCCRQNQGQGGWSETGLLPWSQGHLYSTLCGLASLMDGSARLLV